MNKRKNKYCVTGDPTSTLTCFSQLAMIQKTLEEPRFQITEDPLSVITQPEALAKWPRSDSGAH